MLEWTAAGPGARFCLYVHHTDAEREWAYDRTSSIGRLDKGLDEAKTRGWTVVDMKRDWNTIRRNGEEADQADYWPPTVPLTFAFSPISSMVSVYAT